MNKKEEFVPQISNLPTWLGEGSRGPGVKLLHDFLTKNSYGDNFGPDYDYFGPKTADAVRDLQSYLKISVSGDFNSETRTAVKAKLNFDFEAVFLKTPGETLFKSGPKVSLLKIG